MKNLKKSLALIVLLAMLITIFIMPPQVGAFTSDGQICANIKILLGEGSGVTDAYLAKTSTRLQAAVIALRLMGKEADALAFGGTAAAFSDASKVTWQEGKNLLFYLKTNSRYGWIGFPDGLFKPNDNIDARMMHKVLLEALGYKQGVDFTWNNVISFAKSLGFSKALNASPFTNNNMATALVEALKLKSKGSDITLIQNLVNSGILAEAVVSSAGFSVTKAAMEGNMYVTGFPIVKDKVNLNFFGQHHFLIEEYENVWFVKEYEKKTNVHINWNMVSPDAIEQQKTLLFASGDLPDAFGAVLSPDQLVKYGGQGFLKPLNDIISKYNPVLLKILNDNARIKKLMYAPDGNIYAYPRYTDQYHVYHPIKFWINKSWLDKLKLSVPKTTEELYQVLVAFRDKDPNGNGKKDEIPISAATFWSETLNFVMNAFILDNSDVNHLVVENGKVSFSANNPQYKEGLKYLHRLYAEKLLDSESFTQDYNMILTKGNNADVSIIGSYPAMFPWLAMPIDRALKEYVSVPPLTGPNGVRTSEYYNNIDLRYYSISNKSKYANIAARWIDYFYTEAGVLGSTYGREGLEWKYLDASSGLMGTGEGKTPGPAKYESITTPTAGGESAKNISLSGECVYWTTNDFNGAWSADPTNQTSQSNMYLIEATHPFVGTEMKENFPNALMMSSEEQDSISIEQTQILDYVKEMFAKFVAGQADIDNEWDGYVKKLNDMGLQKYLDLMQNLYTRYINSK